MTVPTLAAGEEGTVPLPDELATAAGPGETWLTVRAELAADSRGPQAGHVVARAQFDLTPARADGAVPGRPPPTTSPTEQDDHDRPGEFDARTGRLRRLHDLVLDGPRLELWRAPTDNDRSASRGSFELAAPEDTAGEGAPGPSSEQRWRERGLDRLVHRVREVRHDHDQLLVDVRVAAANGDLFVDVTYRWLARSRRAPAAGRGHPVIPLGLHLAAGRRTVRSSGRAPDRAGWFGTGPLESYPDTERAARVGRFAASDR